MYGVHDGIATITLNRPDRLNAFTATMAREIVISLDAADADDDVRVVLITGAGRAFCAGADLADGAATFDDSEAGQDGMIGGVPRDFGGIAAMRIAASLKPVIAAINGPAVGVGATMTLPADLRIASDAARFGFVFARRGLVPEAASSWFLPRIVGISQAMEWVATGRVFHAAEALSGGLVSKVVDGDGLLAAANEIAAEIAENTSAVSVALSRRMLWSMLGSSTPWDAHRLDSQTISELGKGPDVTEGVDAFLEKRVARFPSYIADYIDLVPSWPDPPADLA
ncbi:enoyl-CoA hydratase-related protein [Rhodococcus koreensis]